MRRWGRAVWFAVRVALVGPVCLGGVTCKRGEPVRTVVVYCSVDEAFAREVLDRFEHKSQITVSAVFDSEAGKTTGLVRRIEHETDRPRADVFWSSELFNTILLARSGLLAAYDPPAAADIPARYKDAGHRWTGMAVRARVIAFDPERIGDVPIPVRWQDLARPDIAKHVAIANPLFGTTRGHIAAMVAVWGVDATRKFLTDLRDGGAIVTDGNSAAVRAVIAGRAVIAATDTDDVWVARRHGASLDLRYPEMGDGGTLVVPCSVAVIRGGPHPDTARALANFLVSAEVERMLAESTARHIPVRAALCETLGLKPPPASSVSFDAVADAMDEAVRAVRDILIR